MEPAIGPFPSVGTFNSSHFEQNKVFKPTAQGIMPAVFVSFAKYMTLRARRSPMSALGYPCNSPNCKVARQHIDLDGTPTHHLASKGIGISQEQWRPLASFVQALTMLFVLITVASHRLGLDNQYSNLTH